MLFADDELENPSIYIEDPKVAPLDFNPEVSPAFSNLDSDTEPEPLGSNSNDIFAATDDSSSADLNFLAQNPSFCETIGNSQINDENTYVPQLQARESKPSSLCPLSISPFKKSPTGETTKPGNGNDDDDEFDFNAFLGKTSIPNLFRDDEDICPSRDFGLSTIPVCDNNLFSPVVVLPGQDWATLYDVFTCMFFCTPFFPLPQTKKVENENRYIGLR